MMGLIKTAPAKNSNTTLLTRKIKNASAKEFITLKEKSGYTNDELADLVGITHRTIRNKNNKGEIFNIAQTERLRKLDLLFSQGNEIFGGKVQFIEWLKTPAYGLDYTIPLTLIKQPGGLDEVLNELKAIKFGDAV